MWVVFKPQRHKTQVTLLTIAGIWRTREDAKRAGSGPGHAQAMKATSSLYTEWKVERLKLVVGEGARDWHIVKWQD